MTCTARSRNPADRGVVRGPVQRQRGRRVIQAQDDLRPWSLLVHPALLAPGNRRAGCPPEEILAVRLDLQTPSRSSGSRTLVPPSPGTCRRSDPGIRNATRCAERPAQHTGPKSPVRWPSSVATGATKEVGSQPTEGTSMEPGPSHTELTAAGDHGRRTEPRRLRRSRQDRVLAGVCGGLGRYLDLDPVVLRILTLALIFTESVSRPTSSPGSPSPRRPRTNPNRPHHPPAARERHSPSASV